MQLNDQFQASGPIDFLLLEFPDEEPSGDAARALADLVDQGTIAVYDIIAIRKAGDGSVAALELANVSGFGLLGGARSGILTDEDVAEAAVALEPGTVAVLVVYENRWAAPFATAVHNAGGQVVASARIPTQDLIEVLDMLDEQE